ncbi:MAG: hypothetical protein LBB85_03885, partial [Dysgonamonadaceae bacterium]|nr:hypothetical protein [Dysgonamonadaceae bacterium]
MKPVKHILIPYFILLHFTFAFASPERTEIKEGWKFKMARMDNWYPATVPGTVHTDLMAKGIIDDPFSGLNERAVQWVDKEDWVYETTFNLSAKMLAKNNIRLFFKGLDTYADVYLNDKKILIADNMFREWTIDIKTQVKEGSNKLQIYFHSPIKRAMEIYDASEIKYRVSDASDLSQNGGVFNRKLSPYVRKAAYHFGWDWGPRLVTSGIWRPVFLEAWDDAIIENVHIQQNNVTARNAEITETVEILADKDFSDAKILVLDEETGIILNQTTSDLKAGLNKVNIRFSIKNPRLWWSRGLGEQYFYKFKTQIVENNEVVDYKTEKTGIRSLKAIRRFDKSGLGLHFEINGVSVFAKGANYIPCDIFLPLVTAETYRKTIQDAADVNMNMLRVWGGGIYEDDYFYELCDEYGILVWQDFMFACKTYPSRGEFLENIRQEAIDNVRRLRNHACLALWCGNNEIMDALYNWGNDGKGWLEEYRQQNNAEAAETVWQQYYSLFHEVLPEVVVQNDPSTFYVPSSPYNDMKGTRSENSGDMHYWAAWSSALPIATFNEVKSRFFSEYGFQSFPVFESVKKFASNECDWDITSEVMMWHQRGGSKANRHIETCINNEYGKAKDFESLLYLSQLLQGDAMKIAMESHRRNMPFCMGSLYWQINDCWPVASWSSRDYYGRWKAQHYFARKAYDDVLVTANKENDELAVFVVSDRLKPFKADLEVAVITFDGKEVNRYKKAITIPANTSSFSFTVKEADLLKGQAKSDVVVRLKLKEKNGKIYTNNYFLLRQKEMDFPQVEIYKTVTPVEGGFELSLSADKFARAVFVSLEDEKAEFSDNFIDILPNSIEKIIIKTGLSQRELLKSLKVTSLSESLENRRLDNAGNSEFNILKFDAKGDGKTINTGAIQTAIDLCAADGGGKVTVPAGVFVTGTLYMKDNVTLYISENATLKGSPSFADYPDNQVKYTNSFSHSGKLFGNKALIFGENLHNISITGKGTIDGSGDSPEFQLGNDSHPQSRQRPSVICFIKCNSVKVEGLRMQNSAYWMQNYIGCNTLTLRNLNVYNHSNYNQDAMDIDASNVLVENCIIDADDDGVCLKSHNADRIVENIVVRNCTIASNCNAVKFGTKSDGGFRNVKISNCIIHKASADHIRHWQENLKFIELPTTVISGFAFEAVDGGIIENIEVSDITMTDVQTPVFVILGRRNIGQAGDTAFYREDKPLDKSLKTGHARNLTFRNITATSHSKMSSSVTASAGNFVENIRFENVKISS